MKTWITISAVSFWMIVLSGCVPEGGNQSNDNAGNQTTASPPPPSIQPRPFDADSAYAYVERQVAFGPRVPGTPAHAACADWLVAKFKRFGAHTQVQTGLVRTFDGKQVNLKNIIASYNPENTNRIILSAHWDSRPIAEMDPERPNEPIAAANDGGSGVGVLLELARQFQADNPNIGIDIILWDAEDMGDPDNQSPDTYGLGSQFWGRNPHRAGYSARFCINLDMVGASDATFLQEGYSIQYARWLVERVWQSALALGHSQFRFQQGPPITDDHYYVNKLTGIPAVNIIDLRTDGQSSFFPHWHTHRDDMSTIDRKTLAAVGTTLLHVVYEEGDRALQ